MNNELLHDVAVRQIQEVLASDRFQGLSVVLSPGQTGTSFFQGKDRLCKVLKTKRGLRIEINVGLPDKIAKIDGMETIEPETAYLKHYGTVRHIYRGEDIPAIKMIMTEAVQIFKENMAVKQLSV